MDRLIWESNCCKNRADCMNSTHSNICRICRHDSLVLQCQLEPTIALSDFLMKMWHVWVGHTDATTCIRNTAGTSLKILSIPNYCRCKWQYAENTAAGSLVICIKSVDKVRVKLNESNVLGKSKLSAASASFTSLSPHHTCLCLSPPLVLLFLLSFNIWP